MFIKLFLAGSFSLLLSLQAFAYDNISLQDLMAVAEINMKSNPDIALEKIALIENDQQDVNALEVGRIKALALTELGRFDEAMEQAERICGLANPQLVDTSVKCYLLKGRILDEGQNYLRANDFYALALSQISQISDPVLLNRFHLYASDLMRHMGYFNKSLETINSVVSKGVSTPYYAEAVLSKGKSYFRLRNWAAAGDVIGGYLALPELKETSSIKVNMLGYLLVIYSKQFQTEKVSEINTQLEQLLPFISSRKMIAEVMLNKGKMLTISAQSLGAEAALLFALSAAKDINNFRLMVQISSELNDFYRQTGQIEKAHMQLHSSKEYYKYQLDVSRPLDIKLLKNTDKKIQMLKNETITWPFAVAILVCGGVLFLLGHTFGMHRAKRHSDIVIDGGGKSQEFIEIESLKGQLKKEEEALFEMEQLLVQQSKMASMGEMMAVVVHQWKQPLAAIQLISHSLKTNLESSQLDVAAGITDNKKLLDQTENMVATLHDFSRFFKPIDGDQKFNPHNELISSMALVKHQIQKEKTVIQADISDDVKTVFVDGNANEFKQVLVNLITNAGDAVCEFGDDGIIDIRMRLEDQNICIDVIDNGHGMASDVMKEVFKSWFTTKKDKGSGIGLYISKLIVETRLYGELNVKSDGEGKGCQFSIRIPISEARG